MRCHPEQSEGSRPSSRRAAHMAKPTRRNRRSVSPKRASFRLVTPPDAPRSVGIPSVSACAPGTACRASTLRCVVISLRTGFSASYFLRLAMPVQVLRTFPATARCALVSPASLLGALFLLRKTVPFSRPRRQSQFCPPAAVAYLPQNDRKRGVILSGAIPLRGTRGSRA